MTDMWALGYILGVCIYLSWFDTLVGPPIHVKSMCRCVICQGLPPLDR
jgi:hypothetical protein